jgi:hypothetical protein
VHALRLIGSACRRFPRLTAVIGWARHSLQPVAGRQLQCRGAEGHRPSGQEEDYIISAQILRDRNSWQPLIATILEIAPTA